MADVKRPGMSLLRSDAPLWEERMSSRLTGPGSCSKSLSGNLLPDSNGPADRPPHGSPTPGLTGGRAHGMIAPMIVKVVRFKLQPARCKT